jgi:hypothetical protein
MAALSDFASDLLEEAKRFLEKASESADSDGKKAFLHSALLVGFAAFEAHVNAIADDFLTRPDLTPHERGLLAEAQVDLVDGQFRVKEDTLKIQRLDDRILFLCRRFSATPIDRKASYWGEFIEATRLRNKLTHPKGGHLDVKEADVQRTLRALIELLNVMYLAIYKKKLPAYGHSLVSKSTF